MYEQFDHTADLGIRVNAPDLDILFREAAEALFAVIVEDIPASSTSEHLRFGIDAPRVDDLLVDWLSELLYVFDTRRLLLRDFKVHVTSTGLTATATAHRLDPSIHHLSHEVKAVTYHALKVEQTRDGWQAELILDI